MELSFNNNAEKKIFDLYKEEYEQEYFSSMLSAEEVYKVFIKNGYKNNEVSSKVIFYDIEQHFNEIESNIDVRIRIQITSLHAGTIIDFGSKGLRRIHLCSSEFSKARNQLGFGIVTELNDII